MRVNPVDVVGKLAREHAGLAEAPAAVDRAVALQVGPKCLLRAPKAGLRLRPFAPGADARRIVLQVFGEIEHIRRDLAVQIVHFALGRVPERDDELRDPALLKAQDFLRDEGLRKAGIALHDCGDPVHGPRANPGAGRGAGCSKLGWDHCYLQAGARAQASRRCISTLRAAPSTAGA